jgi:hypothetical protein
MAGNSRRRVDGAAVPRYRRDPAEDFMLGEGRVVVAQGVASGDQVARLAANHSVGDKFRRSSGGTAKGQRDVAGAETGQGLTDDGQKVAGVHRGQHAVSGDSDFDCAEAASRFRRQFHFGRG